MPNGIPNKTIENATKYGMKKVSVTVPIRNTHTCIRPNVEDHFRVGDFVPTAKNGSSRVVIQKINEAASKLSNINFSSLSSLHAE